MKFIAIGIGSNATDGQRFVTEACSWITGKFKSVRHTAPYSTRGLGVRSAGKTYTNAVAVAQTSLSADDIVALFKNYERSCGRIPGDEEVPVDLDLVVYDDIILRPDDFEQPYFTIGYRTLLG